MASVEMQLVCKIIKTGDLKRVIEWGITAEDFMMLETRAIYQQLVATYSAMESSGSVIGPRLAQEKFSQLNLNEVDEHVTIEHLCQEVRLRRISKELKEGAQEVLELADANPMGAFEKMQVRQGTILRLDSGKNTDVDFGVGMTKVLDKYNRVKAGGTLGIYSWPWAGLQNETGGVEIEDYVVFYGRPKSMKSWVLSYLISWAVQEEQRVLVYTKEMTAENIYMRIAACLAQLPYSDLRHAKLTEDQETLLNYYVDLAKSLAGQNKLIVLSAKDAAGRDTVSWLRAKVEKYSPTVCFVDGLYLMTPENPKISKDNERVASISRAMRQLILDAKVPVIATMQANRKAAQHGRAELDEIAFSDALSQDCTLAVRVINDKNAPTISLVVGGAREVNLAGIRIMGIPATNFSYHSTLTEAEIMKAQNSDAPPEEDKKGGRSPREPKTIAPARAQAEAAHQKAYQNALKNV